MKIVAGIFLIIHGLVHLLYFGHALRYFELQPGMAWPDGSWAFSKVEGVKPARRLAGILCVMAALVFTTSGILLLANVGAWRKVVLVAAGFSSLIYILFWDGKIQKLNDKGGICILINLAIFVVAYVVQWP